VGGFSHQSLAPSDKPAAVQVSLWQGVLKHIQKNQQTIRNTIVQAAVSIQYAVYSSIISIKFHHLIKKKFSKQLLQHVAQKLPMYYNHNVYSNSTTHLKVSCYKTELYLSGLTAELL